MTVNKTNLVFRLDLGNGDVTIHKKHTVVLQCGLNLKDFPFDKSVCKMKLRKIENLPISLSLIMDPALTQSDLNYQVDRDIIQTSLPGIIKGDRG